MGGERGIVSADVHAWSDGQSEVAVDIYHAVSASDAVWSLVHSEVVGSGVTTVSSDHLLPGGSPNQVFRVNIRYGGTYSTDGTGCSGGQYDDTDDLVFTIAQDEVTTTTTTTTSTTTTATTTTCVDPTTHAEMGCVARSGDFVVEVVLIAVTAARMDLASTKNRDIKLILNENIGLNYPIKYD